MDSPTKKGFDCYDIYIKDVPFTYIKITLQTFLSSRMRLDPATSSLWLASQLEARATFAKRSKSILYGVASTLKYLMWEISEGQRQRRLQ